MAPHPAATTPLLHTTPKTSKSRSLLLVTPVFFCLFSLSAFAQPASELSEENLRFFESRIRPLLADHCYSCHSKDAERLRADLYLDTRSGMLSGGDLGPVIEPGDPDNSLLIQAVRWQDEDLQMPPKKKLTDRQIADLERWVTLGAPDPRVDAAEAVTPPDPAEKIDWQVARDHWAYKPPVPQPVPTVNRTDWPRGDIDRFTLAEMESRSLTPVADADKRTLIRRIYFDLIGLPPTPRDVEQFVADRSPDAVEKLVDRLLASPRFGERWGRHWLDVARYAESTGKEANFTFPHAWRYRDYVIDAFNADLPYDQFITEQIAGDLMGGDAPAERDRRLTATAFLALGPKSLNESNRVQFAMDLADEQIDTLTRTVLATTVACARCHDHKFDPITQRDYYALAGIFTSTETHYGTVAIQGNRRSSTLLELETPPTYSSTDTLTTTERRRITAQLEDLNKQLAGLRQQARQARLAQRPAARPMRNRPGAAAPDADPARTDTATPAETAARPPQRDNVQLFQQVRRLTSQIALLEERLSNYDESGNPRAYTMGVGDLPRPINTRIYIRGEVDKPSDFVPRGFPTILTPADYDYSDRLRGSGRLQLAQLLTDPENPLTARVHVNRVWQHLLGVPLVPTPDNFGSTGQPPSHPALLDHLALTFIADGWSTKALIKRVVLSRTYQLAAKDDKANLQIDERNTYLWRANRKRLEGEAIRDAMLAVSGNLDLTRPYGSPVAAAGSGYVGRNIRDFDPNADNFHRSVYLPVVRDLTPEALAVFDFAEPSLVTAQRDVTTVPSQALYLMNDTFVRQQAESAARSLLADLNLDDAGRIDTAFLLTLGRPPSSPERQAVVSLLTAVHRQSELEGARPGRAKQDAWASLVHSLFMTAEFRYLD